MTPKTQKNSLDILAIGDIANDVFITLDTAYGSIEKKGDAPVLVLPYGTKIPFTKATKVSGVGNSPNAAVSATKLGLSVSLLSHIGNDKEGEETTRALMKHYVGLTGINISLNKKTNVHYVLHFKDDRTILVNHEHYNYDFKREIIALGGVPEFIYLSSIGSGTEQYHTDIIDYVKNNEVQLVFQPGTFQISKGYAGFHEIYESSLLVIVNVEEAELLLNSTKWKKANYNKKSLAKLLHNFGQKLTIVTDGPNGCYLFDGNYSYFLPIYPDPKPPVERTGAGDAFASTVTAFLQKGMSIQEAILRGPVNSMNVVQYIGAQEGLLTIEQINEHLKYAPKHYRLEHIEA